MTCNLCGRVFEGDPLYEQVGAVPEPGRRLGRQVIAYHTVRLRFEGEGCAALGKRCLS